MNDADTKKLYAALAITVNLEAQLTNFLGRSGRAGKAWTGWLKSAKPDPAQAAEMKTALSTLSKMMKDAKLVLKDLDKATREAGNKATLAKYATGKEYRDKVLAKQLTSVRAWDQNCTKFIASMTKVVVPFPYPKPTGAGVDETVTFNSAKNFVQYYDEMKKGLAQLG
ncbi:MAG TPA: hypothetical protein VKB75_11905 [Jatrophihabitans sp.]|nr:hypothetical protein [Jatrophihabitans sp.]